MTPCGVILSELSESKDSSRSAGVASVPEVDRVLQQELVVDPGVEPHPLAGVQSGAVRRVRDPRDFARFRQRSFEILPQGVEGGQFGVLALAFAIRSLGRSEAPRERLWGGGRR